ncbi:MAG: extracellular solute-binding protein [Spirochaetes bacterium]|nr:extracellular solute-binding protein [Spirochaetota bacterium]
MKKLSRAIFVIAIFTILFSGCKKEKSAEVYNGEEVTLKLGVFPSLDVAYEALLADFNKDFPNIKVEIESMGYGDHHNGLVTTIAAGTGAPDVAAVEIGFLGQLSDGGGFVNLLEAPYNAGQYKDKIVPYAWAQASISDKEVVGIPVDIGPGCAIYRKDKFEEVGLSIDNIKTWDDLYEAGKKLTRDTNGDGKVDHWLLTNAINIVRSFVYSTPYAYFDENGKPDLNNEYYQYAFTMAKKFRDAGMDAQVQDWSPEWIAAFKDGVAAYTPFGSWFVGSLKSWIAPDAKDKFRISELPALKDGDQPFKASWGGSFLTIPSQSKNKAAAWELIKFIATKTENQLASYQTANTFPAWLDAWEKPEFNKPEEYLGNQDIKPMLKSIAKARPGVYTSAYDNMALNFLTASLNDYLEGKTGLEEALKQAESKLSKQMEL